jgi:excisionase family DNA binding protein
MGRFEDSVDSVSESRRGGLPRQRKRVREYYSVAEVAAKFGLSTMTVYRAIQDGEFPAVKIRGRVIIPVRAIEAMGETAIAEGVMVDTATWVPDESGR